MLQVLRAYKKSSFKTLFLSINIMDATCAQKQLNQLLDKSKLHLLGLVCILIASKIEDPLPIFLEDLVIDAGHNRFSEL
jgi:hypothetical protein